MIYIIKIHVSLSQKKRREREIHVSYQPYVYAISFVLINRLNL